MKKINNKKGFTIVELVIVIAVIGILAAVLIPTFSGVVDKANASAALQTARSTLTNALNMSTTAQLQGEDTNGYHTYILVNGYAYAYEGNELVAVDYPGTGSTTTIPTNATYDSSKKAITKGVNTIAIAADNLVAQENNDANYTITGTEPSDWSTTYKNYFKKDGSKFTAVSDSSAPTWSSATYYSKNATASVYDINNVAEVITGATDITSITNVTLVDGIYYVNPVNAGSTAPNSGSYYSVKSGDTTTYYTYAAKLLINSDFSEKVVVLTYFN